MRGNVLPFSAKDLPSLLTSSGDAIAGLTANEDGSIAIASTGKSFIPEAALAVHAGGNKRSWF